MSSGTAQIEEIDLEASLRALGYEQFRPGQREAIETLLLRNRLLLVAPTGGGKSLAYQLPASVLAGTTLVVSPLIALMNDQVQALVARGVPATFLAATIDPEESRRRLAAMAHGKYKLVYVAPERLALAGFRHALASLECPLLVVDEAHCISEWGHDFRPEYRKIGALLSVLGPTRVLACTATATPIVRDEILLELGLPPETPQILRGFARPNLHLRVRECNGRVEHVSAIDALLAEVLGTPGAGRGTTIVYSPTRRASEREAERLACAGWRAEAYHAGLSREQRARVQNEFMTGALDVIVATNAFGMGIDRADVRAVAHLAPPGSIEAYYQEVGRAGRDGEPAVGLLLLASEDVPRRRRLIERDRDGTPLAAEVVEHKWNLFLELLRWAQGGSCRHDAILRYFGDEAETLAGCGHCDVCEQLVSPDPRGEAERTEIVRKALSAVARVSGRFGMRAAVNLLRGTRDERLERTGLERKSTFGILREYSDDWLLRLIGRCVTAGWVTFRGEERPVVWLTEAGREVMHAQRPARILLPPVMRLRDSRGTTKPTRKPGSRRDRVEPAHAAASADAALFEALRAWRQSAAKQEGVPAYVIAHDRSLRDVAELRPSSADELRAVWGFGPVRQERYGEEILLVVREACGNGWKGPSAKVGPEAVR